jgi:putative glutamine amidotransferase
MFLIYNSICALGPSNSRACSKPFRLQFSRVNRTGLSSQRTVPKITRPAEVNVQMPTGPSVSIAASPEDTKPLADAVQRAGGSPLVLSQDSMLPDGNALVEGHALVLAADGDPGHVALAKAALEMDMPLLAIGDGIHTLNLALGGGPATPVEGHGPEGETSSYHRIYIAPGSKLAAVVGSGGFVRVNSRHDLSVHQIGKSPYLLASAYSLEDGIIEALESPDHGWVIGVQFRPERRLEIPPHFDRLFQSLVERGERNAAA